MATPIERLVVSSSPHVKSDVTIQSAMRDVIIALIPALALALYFFRWHAAAVIATCVVTAVASEAIFQKIRHGKTTVHDHSAVLTGLLLAFCLPPSLPLWIAAVGAATSIIIGKQLFGGLGHNIFNPAHVGRALLLASWPVAMTTWTRPIDGVTTATPLSILKESGVDFSTQTAAAHQLMNQLPSLWNMFYGNIAGSIGETSALALLIGGAYLCYKGHIDWRISGTFMGTVFFLTAIIGFVTGKGIWYPFFNLFSGGLILGAIYMATDWVTSPITRRGRIIIGLGAGLLTVLIRLKGGYPEGVCYSILLMNCCTPLIDRYSKTRIYGRRAENA